MMEHHEFESIDKYFVEKQDLHFADLFDSDERLFSDHCVSNAIRKPVGIETQLPDIDGMPIHTIFIRKVDDNNYIYLYVYSEPALHIQMYEGLLALGSMMSSDNHPMKIAYSKAVSAYFDYFLSEFEFAQI
jgi:hypothetical protein